MTGIGDAWDKVEETEYRWWNPNRPIELLFTELASEVGEVADAIKRSQGLGSNSRPAGDVAEELADCMSHIIVMCMHLGVSQDEFAAILSRKMDTVDQRMRDRLAKRTDEASA
jgi:NTP pyrophosphatase (non-canonical NTP hydrolase)